MKKFKLGIVKNGFTLMELMVVIVVISILVGLLIPAILRAKEGAREKKARTEIHELQKAWATYIQYYQDLDSKYIIPDYTDMDIKATADLGGGNDAGIVFMEFTPKELAEGFLDPWKELYKLEFQKVKDVETKWKFQTRVQCINVARGKY